MALDMKIVHDYAIYALEKILANVDVSISATTNEENGSLTLEVSKSFCACNRNILPKFMFMKDGEVYFFTLLDKIDLTAENAAIAFETSTSTALNIAFDDYLVVQLGAYIFHEEDAGMLIYRYFDDLIYLLSEDTDMKKLLDRMH